MLNNIVRYSSTLQTGLQTREQSEIERLTVRTARPPSEVTDEEGESMEWETTAAVSETPSLVIPKEATAEERAKYEEEYLRSFGPLEETVPTDETLLEPTEEEKEKEEREKRERQRVQEAVEIDLSLKLATSLRADKKETEKTPEEKEAQRKMEGTNTQWAHMLLTEKEAKAKEEEETKKKEQEEERNRQEKKMADNVQRELERQEKMKEEKKKAEDEKKKKEYEKEKEKREEEKEKERRRNRSRDNEEKMKREKESRLQQEKKRGYEERKKPQRPVNKYKTMTSEELEREVVESYPTAESRKKKERQYEMMIETLQKYELKQMTVEDVEETWEREEIDILLSGGRNYHLDQEFQKVVSEMLHYLGDDIARESWVVKTIKKYLDEKEEIAKKLREEKRKEENEKVEETARDHRQYGYQESREEEKLKTREEEERENREKQKGKKSYTIMEETRGKLERVEEQIRKWNVPGKGIDQKGISQWERERRLQDLKEQKRLRDLMDPKIPAWKTYGIEETGETTQKIKITLIRDVVGKAVNTAENMYKQPGTQWENHGEKLWSKMSISNRQFVKNNKEDKLSWGEEFRWEGTDEEITRDIINVINKVGLRDHKVRDIRDTVHDILYHECFHLCEGIPVDLLKELGGPTFGRNWNDFDVEVENLQKLLGKEHDVKDYLWGLFYVGNNGNTIQLLARMVREMRGDTPQMRRDIENMLQEGKMSKFETEGRTCGLHAMQIRHDHNICCSNIPWRLRRVVLKRAGICTGTMPERSNRCMMKHIAENECRRAIGEICSHCEKVGHKERHVIGQCPTFAIKSGLKGVKALERPMAFRQ